MPEPTTVKFPHGYDDNSTLLGPLFERAVGTVKYSIGVDALQVTLAEALSHLVGPLFVLFEGGEIWYVEAGDIAVVGGETKITIHSIDNRGYNNSPIQPHNYGEKVFFSLHDAHVNQLRQAIMAMQRHGFRLGTSAERGAHVPEAGEAWLETDTNRIYYSFSAGTWTRVSYTDHGELAGLSDDDHPQYHTNARANTWHSYQPGTHITGGDDHDHFSTGQGAAVARVRSGADAAKGTPVVAGEIYFAIDTAQGGTLYISKDGVTWTPISGVPSGAIAPFEGACPAGWSRYTPLDGKYLRASTSSGGVSGGASSHTHEMRQIVQHYHTVDANSNSTMTNPGDHTHVLEATPEQGDAGGRLVTTVLPSDTNPTGPAGSHSHTLTIPATTTSTAGTSYPSTASASLEPPYKELVFCKKD